MHLLCFHAVSQIEAVTSYKLYNAVAVIDCFVRDGDKMAPSVEKKIEELEMGLLHLQQNIDIPEITLTVHPVVASIIKKCAEEGTKPKVSDFGDRVEDATFLNALQSGVNRWIREIQKVVFFAYCFIIWLALCHYEGPKMGVFH